MLIPTPDQWKAIDQMSSEPTRAALCAAETGVGKTLLAVEVTKRLGARTALVIAPPNTVKGWRTTFAGQESGLDFHVIDSSVAGKQAYDNLKNAIPGVYFVSRQFFVLSGSSAEPKPSRVKGRAEYHLYANNRRVRQHLDGSLVWQNENGNPSNERVPLIYRFEGRHYVGAQRVVVDDKSHAYKADEKGEVVLSKGREALWSWVKVKPDITIYDEVQAVSNRWSGGFTVLKQIKHGYRLAMSATPQGNRFDGIWSVCRWLWPNDRNEQGELYVDNSKQRWIAQWCSTVKDRYTFTGEKPDGEKEPGKFVSTLPCYVRIEADRKPVDEREIIVELSPVQRKMYDEMEQQALAWLGEHPLVEDVPAVQRIRMRQIALGELSIDEFDEVSFDEGCNSSKIDALEKVLTNHDTAIIFTDSKKFAKVVAKRIPDAVAWTGDNSAAQRDEMMAGFGKTFRYLVASIAAISEGTDGLQHVTNVEVWLSKNLNNMLNIQAEGRINRTGQPADEIVSYVIKAKDTDDDDRFQNLVDQTIAMRESLKKEA